jgi:hypothetical protein
MPETYQEMNARQGRDKAEMKLRHLAERQAFHEARRAQPAKRPAVPCLEVFMYYQDGNPIADRRNTITMGEIRAYSVRSHTPIRAILAVAKRMALDVRH